MQIVLMPDHPKLDEAARHKLAAEIEYRTIKADELEQMGNVFNVAFHAGSDPKLYGQRFKNCSHPVLERQFVAVHGGKLVAGIRADFKPLYFIDGSDKDPGKHNCGEINDVATLPDYQGMGIARQLINMATAYIDGQGWDLSVLQADPKYFAKDLYESVGFKTLQSTGDVFSVALGSWRARFDRYGPLALFFPLLPAVARRVAPSPPRYCLELVDREDQAPRPARDPAPHDDRFTTIHVTGRIARSDPWVARWRDCINVAKRAVQGLHDSFLREVLLDYELDEPAPARVKDWLRKTKPGRSILEETGGIRGYMLLLDVPRGTHLAGAIPSPTVPAKHVVGGARFKIEHFQRGRFSVTLPMIDAFCILPEHQGRGLGGGVLARDLVAWLGRAFPFVVCRVASGSVALRRALRAAGFHEVAGGITMVRPGRNRVLYDKLAGAVEPWILY